MISARDIISDIMDEFGWDEIQEWIPPNSPTIKIAFEQRPQDQEGSVEIEKGIYFVVGGLATKKFEVSDRKVSWKSGNKSVTVDLADPSSLEMIADYVKEK